MKMIATTNSYSVRGREEEKQRGSLMSTRLHSGVD
jgi:hypothetical protein